MITKSLYDAVLQHILLFGNLFDYELRDKLDLMFNKKIECSDYKYKVGQRFNNIYASNEDNKIVIEAHYDKVIDYNFEFNNTNDRPITKVINDNNLIGCLDNSVGAGIVTALHDSGLYKKECMFLLTPYEEVGGFGISCAVKNKLFENKSLVIVLDISDDYELENKHKFYTKKFDICFYSYKNTDSKLKDICTKLDIVERQVRFNNAVVLDELLKINIISFHFQIKKMHKINHEELYLPGFMKAIEKFRNFLDEVISYYY